MIRIDMILAIRCAAFPEMDRPVDRWFFRSAFNAEAQSFQSGSDDRECHVALVVNRRRVELFALTLKNGRDEVDPTRRLLGSRVVDPAWIFVHISFNAWIARIDSNPQAWLSSWEGSA